MSERARRFDALHTARPEPWDAAESPYERDKFADTLAVLPPGRLGRALDVGCSTGVLTRALAQRCAAVTAVDVSSVALGTAALRCAGAPVTFVRAEVPAFWPEGAFDLVVMSEVLYFLSAQEVTRLAGLVTESLAPGGHALLVDYLGPCDLALDGQAAARLFIAAAGTRLQPVRTLCRPRYRIDVLAAGSAR